MESRVSKVSTHSSVTNASIFCTSTWGTSSAISSLFTFFLKIRFWMFSWWFVFFLNLYLFSGCCFFDCFSREPCRPLPPLHRFCFSLPITLFVCMCASKRRYKFNESFSNAQYVSLDTDNAKRVPHNSPPKHSKVTHNNRTILTHRHTVLPLINEFFIFM